MNIITVKRGIDRYGIALDKMAVRRGRAKDNKAWDEKYGGEVQLAVSGREILLDSLTDYLLTEGYVTLKS